MFLAPNATISIKTLHLLRPWPLLHSWESDYKTSKPRLGEKYISRMLGLSLFDHVLVILGHSLIFIKAVDQAQSTRYYFDCSKVQSTTIIGSTPMYTKPETNHVLLNGIIK